MFQAQNGPAITPVGGRRPPPSNSQADSLQAINQVDLIDKTDQSPSLIGPAQFGQSFFFDLADALAG